LKCKIQRTDGGEPFHDLGRFAPDDLLDNRADDLPGLAVAIDGIEEARGLLMKVALCVPSEEGAVRQFRCSEQ
jgi:hypothetical protein